VGLQCLSRWITRQEGRRAAGRLVTAAITGGTLCTGTGQQFHVLQLPADVMASRGSVLLLYGVQAEPRRLDEGGAAAAAVCVGGGRGWVVGQQMRKTMSPSSTLLINCM